MLGLILLLVFVPTFLYVALLWWLDRYEKEPLFLLSAAFLWGGIPAIILALILEVILDIPITAFSPSPLTYELLGASVVAPFVEEAVKGAALLILLLFWRREIDSPLDGLVYGGIVGFGFAAVEDVFYLMDAYDSGGAEGAISLALLRLLLFGLNHAMYTGFTGLGLALALEARQPAWRFTFPVAGFSLGVAAHALHNTLATILAYSEGWGSLCIAAGIDWIGVGALLLVAVWALTLEKRRLMAYLDNAVLKGLVNQKHIPILISPWQRSLTRFLALLGGDVKRVRSQTRYFHTVTEAAFDWHRSLKGDLKSQERLAITEQTLLGLPPVLD